MLTFQLAGQLNPDELITCIYPLELVKVLDASLVGSLIDNETWRGLPVVDNLQINIVGGLDIPLLKMERVQ